MKYIVGGIFCLISVFIYWYWDDSFVSEEFPDVKDVTGSLQNIFKELDIDQNEVLNEVEFLRMKNLYIVLQKHVHDIQSEYLIQEFPNFTIHLGEQVINVEVDFQPLNLKSMLKNISDLSEEEAGSLLGLLNWKNPFKERHPFGAKAFLSFLPPKKDAQPGFTWWIVEPKIKKNSPPLSNQRYYPPKVPQNILILHALLSLFHPHPFLWTRFQPQGTTAVIRAVEDNFYDIVFRVHAEFQLNKPPLHPFWFTPSQFQGRLIINKESSVIKFFHMEVPDTRLNVDMEWLNGPTEDSMEVDIGYIPKMSLVSSAISVPSKDEKGAHQKLSTLKWNSEITMEEALNLLELQSFF
ncbi:Selenoprotein N like protein [Argiope bruennichi]|uniref:Selenoprotein N like protein n=1 Tax=Argiope bruennichi TaxID=94029 RepID=A0A8T0FY51_ARGBR|nr:Selenoprotein N like protein [Argiope bruennichi]